MEKLQQIFNVETKVCILIHILLLYPRSIQIETSRCSQKIPLRTPRKKILMVDKYLSIMAPKIKVMLLLWVVTMTEETSGTQIQVLTANKKRISQSPI